MKRVFTANWPMQIWVASTYFSLLIALPAILFFFSHELLRKSENRPDHLSFSDVTSEFRWSLRSLTPPGPKPALTSLLSSPHFPSHLSPHPEAVTILPVSWNEPWPPASMAHRSVCGHTTLLTVDWQPPREVQRIFWPHMSWLLFHGTYQIPVLWASQLTTQQRKVHHIHKWCPGLDKSRHVWGGAGCV